MSHDRHYPSLHVSYLRSGHVIFQERDRAMRMLVENICHCIEPALPVVNEGGVCCGGCCCGGWFVVGVWFVVVVGLFLVVAVPSMLALCSKLCTSDVFLFLSTLSHPLPPHPLQPPPNKPRKNDCCWNRRRAPWPKRKHAKQHWWRNNNCWTTWKTPTTRTMLCRTRKGKKEFAGTKNGCVKSRTTKTKKRRRWTARKGCCLRPRNENGNSKRPCAKPPSKAWKRAACSGWRNNWRTVGWTL